MRKNEIRKGKVLEVVPSRTMSDGREEFKDGEGDVEKAAIRKRVGLTYEKLCKTISDGLVAETALYDKNGKIVNTIPANSERAKFLQAAVDLLGAKKIEGAAQKCARIIIELPDGIIWNPRQR